MHCYRGTVQQAYRYAAMLCGHDRDGAEDLVQETYLDLLRRVRAGSLTMLTPAYLLQAVRHRFLDMIKQRDRERRRLELVGGTAADDLTPGTTVRGLLADLPDRERAAMVLRFVDDLPVAGVAEAMGITVRAAESLLARATRRLREGDQRHA